MQSSAGKAWINLQRTSILLIDDGLGLEILSQVFYGLGARDLFRCRTAVEALDLLSARPLDLIVVEAELHGGDGYALVRQIRAGDAGDNNRFTPVIVLSAHTASNKVANSRDCGANFFVAKPISPQVIMDRLLWVARENRQYLEAETYVGPDRRFQTETLSGGVTGRRRGDREPDPAQPPEEQVAS